MPPKRPTYALTVAPLLKFTVLRLALFVAALAVLALFGARGWLLLLLAAVVSLALSYVLLRGPRAELAAAIEQRTARRLGSDEQAEDAEAEAATDTNDGDGDGDTGGRAPR